MLVVEWGGGVISMTVPRRRIRQYGIDGIVVTGVMRPFLLVKVLLNFRGRTSVCFAPEYRTP